jgi:hypothetical protein
MTETIALAASRASPGHPASGGDPHELSRSRVTRAIARAWSFTLALAAASLVAGMAQAQISLSPRTSPALGNTIQGSTTTTFSLSTSGAVTRISGDAIRLSNSSVTAPTVSFSCGLLNLGGLCALRPLRVTIAPSVSDGARISRFRVSNLSGATYRNGAAPADGQVVTFDVNPLGLLSTGSFRLGMDIEVAGRATPGIYPLSYTVIVQLL